MDVIDAGRLGGQSTLQKRGKAYFKEISLKGVEAKKNKKSRELIRKVSGIIP